MLSSVGGGGVGGLRSILAQRRLRNALLANSGKRPRNLVRSGSDADASVPLPFWHPTTPALAPGFGNKIEAGAGDNLDNHALDYNDDDGDYVVDRPVVPQSDFRDAFCRLKPGPLGRWTTFLVLACAIF